MRKGERSANFFRSLFYYFSDYVLVGYFSEVSGATRGSSSIELSWVFGGSSCARGGGLSSLAVINQEIFEIGRRKGKENYLEREYGLSLSSQW